MLKKIIISLLFAVVASGCVQNQPQVKLQCWNEVTSVAFPFVISAINICDGPEGGTVKYTVIQPIIDFVDKRNKVTDEMARQQLKTNRMDKLY